MKKTIAVFATAAIFAGALAGCSSGTKNTVSISAAASVSSAAASTASDIVTSGSTALQPLLQSAISPFKAQNASFTGSISVGGGGSGQGLTDVMNGTVNIGDSDVTPDDIGVSASGLVDHKVCVVAVGIAVSSNVYENLSSISSSDLKNIFSGTYTNWKQISGWKGGSLPIQVFYRKPNSGTRVLFEKYGSGVNISDAQIASLENFTRKDSSGDLETAITSASASVGAIGYESLPYCTNLKLLKLDDVECTYDNVYTGKYKIWGYEHMYTNGTPDSNVQAFIDYIMSDNFSNTITSSGYGLISSMKVER